MPDEFPVAAFNETNIKQGSLNITGIKESDIISGVDVSYIDPTNHYKRETVRVDSSDANDGVEKNIIKNITSLDLRGVTRRSQALRFAQYQIAASKYNRRSIIYNFYRCSTVSSWRRRICRTTTIWNCLWLQW